MGMHLCACVEQYKVWTRMVFMDGLQETISSFDTATTYKKLATTTMHELNARPAPPRVLEIMKIKPKEKHTPTPFTKTMLNRFVADS